MPYPTHADALFSRPRASSSSCGLCPDPWPTRFQAVRNGCTRSSTTATGSALGRTAPCSPVESYRLGLEPGVRGHHRWLCGTLPGCIIDGEGCAHCDDGLPDFWRVRGVMTLRASLPSTS
jgi:hypothetical protein